MLTVEPSRYLTYLKRYKKYTYDKKRLAQLDSFRFRQKKVNFRFLNGTPFY